MVKRSVVEASCFLVFGLGMIGVAGLWFLGFDLWSWIGDLVIWDLIGAWGTGFGEFMGNWGENFGEFISNWGQNFGAFMAELFSGSLIQLIMAAVGIMIGVGIIYSSVRSLRRR